MRVRGDIENIEEDKYSVFIEYMILILIWVISLVVIYFVVEMWLIWMQSIKGY